MKPCPYCGILYTIQGMSNHKKRLAKSSLNEENVATARAIFAARQKQLKAPQPPQSEAAAPTQKGAAQAAEASLILKGDL